MLHRIASYVAFLNKPFGSRTDLLDLVEGSTDLDKLHHQFLSDYKSISCICFYECVPEYVLGVDIGRVFSQFRVQSRLNHGMDVGWDLGCPKSETRRILDGISCHFRSYGQK